MDTIAALDILKLLHLQLLHKLQTFFFLFLENAGYLRVVHDGRHPEARNPLDDFVPLLEVWLSQCIVFLLHFEDFLARLFVERIDFVLAAVDCLQRFRLVLQRVVGFFHFLCNRSHFTRA